MSTIKSAVVSVTFRQKSPEEIVAISKKAGIGGIEWGSDVHVLPGDIAFAERVRKMTEDAGLDVASYGSYYYAAHDGNKFPFEQVLESAAALGAPNIRIWAGLGASKDATAERRAEITADIVRCASLAAEKGITLSLEYHANTLTDTFASTMQLLEEANHPNLYTYWQPPLDVADAQHEVDLAALLKTGRVTNAHVYRWIKDGDVITQYPLEAGKELWAKWLALLDGTPRYACMEFVKDGTDEQFLQDAAVLNGLIASI